MQFVISTDLRDTDGQPISGKFDVIAGLFEHDNNANVWFRISGEPESRAKEVVGRLNFPERAQFTFDGSLASFKGAIHKAASWYQLARDPRFDWIRD